MPSFSDLPSFVQQDLESKARVTPPINRPSLPGGNMQLENYPLLPDKNRTYADPFNIEGKDNMLTNTQGWAADPEFKAKYPATAAMAAYQNPYAMEESIPYKIAKPVGNWFRQGGGIQNMISSGLNSGMLPAALTLGGIGGLAGILGGGTAGMISGDGFSDGASRWGLRGGIGGGLLGLLAGYLRQSPYDTTGMNDYRIKRASFASAGDPLSSILGALNRAPGLSSTKQQQLATGVFGLSESERRQLWRALSTASGAAVGAIVARFVSGGGGMSTLGGGLLGGLLGNSLGNYFTRPRNAFGQSVLKGVDFYGTPY